MAIRRQQWTAEELLVVFQLYCRLPFGRLNHQNKQIIALAERMGRTPSSVSMKACNFASLDPEITKTRTGLKNASKADRDLWARFMADSESVADEAERAWERLWEGTAPSDAAESDFEVVMPSGETERLTTAKARRVQDFFRRTVSISYGSRCAVTGIGIRGMLTASHIIPWKDNAARRADPTNGIFLNALHDRAFDRGLITFDEELRLVTSPSIREVTTNEFMNNAFTKFEGKVLQIPERFLPDPVALEYHRERCFIG